MSKARDIADLDFNAPDIDGGNIDGAVIGGTTPAAGTFSQVNVDNITIDGNEIDVGSGNLTLDVAGDIVLNADGGDWLFNDGAVTLGSLQNDGNNNLIVMSNTNDKDIKFLGIDNSNTITALTLDMSAAGAATFNDLINIGGSSLNFTKVDGVGINAKESLSITIDSDNNDASRVFSVLDGNGTTLMQVTDAGEATFNQGAVFNEAGVDSDFRVESDSNANMLFVDGGENRVAVGASGASQTGSKFYVEGRSTLYNGSVTGGSVLITDAYAGATDDHLLNIGTQHSSGGPFISYGLGQNGSGADWVSTYDNFSGSHSTLTFNGSTLEYYCDVSNSQTTVGDVVAVTNGFKVGRDGAIFNDDGHADFDFRVESDTRTHAFFVDGNNASNRLKLGIGTSSISNPYGQDNFTDLNIDGVWGGAISFKLGGTEKGWIGQRNSGNGGMALGSSSGNNLYLNSGGNTSRMEFSSAGHVLVNPTGLTTDFTVRTDNQSSMLHVDGGADFVGIKQTSDTGSSFAVQGAIATYNSYGDLASHSATNGTALSCGEIEHNIGYSGTFAAGKKWTWTYAALSWKAFRVQIEIGSTQGFAVFEGGGYNNNGLTAHVIEQDSNNVGTLSITNNGQQMIFTLTLNNTSVHPFIKFTYGQSGGDGAPLMSRLSLVQN